MRERNDNSKPIPASRRRRTGIAALAARSYTVITQEQILSEGATRSWITREVAAGRLHRLYPGVYSLVAPALLRIEARWLSAVLACGEGAALSRQEALALWELRPVGSGPIHVTVPAGSGRRSRHGLVIHRSKSLGPADVTIHRGIPVTTVRRTIADVRRALPPHQLRSVLRRAQARRLDIGPQPEDLPNPEWSELERRFEAVCRRHSLPVPEAQRIVGPFTVDFLWPEERVIVEVDGWETHGARTAFEADRERDAWLTARGYRVLRFTWQQVVSRGPWMAATIRAALAVAA